MKDNFWKNFHHPFRRDFTIFDEYVYAAEEPLEVAIVAFLSAKDPKITTQLMTPWSEQTRHTASFEVVDFPGDHFYVQDRKIVPDLVKKISEYLTKVKGGDFPPPLPPAEEETNASANGAGEFIQEDLVRKINLLEILEEDYPDVDPPPEDCVEKWTEQEIRAHFTA
mmetsp:Transcript_12939/g.32704  ORF Transcript_12939/g.32704 Transcript_12939/m.32704 type:complete len:167 (+) Transcript_12939:745-1245(+)